MCEYLVRTNPDTTMRNLCQFGRRVPLILQADPTQNVPACIAMMLEYLGATADLESICQQMGTSGSRPTFGSLINLASAVGLVTRAVKIDPIDLTEVTLPAFIFWRKRFVVLIRATKRSISINDPALGQRKFAYHEVSKHLNGIAVEVSRAQGRSKTDFVTSAKMRFRSDTIPHRHVSKFGLFANREIEVRNLRYHLAQDVPGVDDPRSIKLVRGELAVVLSSEDSAGTNLLAQLSEGTQLSAEDVSVDGRQVGLDAYHFYRQRIAVVPKSVGLFPGTIRQNVSMHDGTLTSTEIQSACEGARIHESICELQGGYDTYVDRKQTLLSPSQVQQLGIARALARNPMLVLLEDSTIALGDKLEQELIEQICRRNIGVLLVTNRNAFSWLPNIPIRLYCLRGLVFPQQKTSDIAQPPSVGE